MILKLRNEKIFIEKNSVPEHVDNIIVMYDFELGTNHYGVKLTIDDTVVHYGNYLTFKYDSNKPSVNLKVELYDTHDTVMRTYTGTFNYYKTCLIGDDKLIDMHKELERLTILVKELQEKGEVI